jgi:hypothetical protein
MYLAEDNEDKWLRSQLIEARDHVAAIKRILERCGLVDELDEAFAEICDTCDAFWENR